VLPSETTTTTTTTPLGRSSVPAVPVVPVVPVAPAVPAVAATADDVVLAPGDDLWSVATRRLAVASGRAPADVPVHEVAPYWVRVCDANRDRWASGDPNLVFPGEHVVLPPIELPPG
jgi:hypothetical protein